MPHKDPERAKAYQKDYARKRRGTRGEYMKQYNDAHQQQRRDWYRDHREESIARSVKWRETNPEGGFDAHLRRKYGLSREKYDEMVVNQGNKCAICGSPPVGRTKRGPAERLDVDHDHDTGEVRGLICHPCNVMLGQARDNVEVLEAAILYLKRYKDAKRDNGVPPE